MIFSSPFCGAQCEKMSAVGSALRFSLACGDRLFCLMVGSTAENPSFVVSAHATLGYS